VRAALVSVVMVGCSSTGGLTFAGGDAGGDAGAPRDPGFNQASVCQSMSYWKPDPITANGSADMFPGEPCLACHANPPPPYTHQGPPYVIGGTVFTTGHVPDACQPTADEQAELSQAMVYARDAKGMLVSMIVHPSGNFYPKGLTMPVIYPITAWVSYQGRERHMLGAQMSGDCNTCHTDPGASGAPGRIVLP
jgi:hypothetical protein